jgi:hypothetical protein
VERTFVSVWVALSEEATVTLSIFKGPQVDKGVSDWFDRNAAKGFVREEFAPTRAIGARLHVALITVHIDPP